MIDETINEEEVEELPEVTEGEEDTTDWKALAIKQAGMAKRFATKLKKLADKPSEPKPQAQPATQPAETKKEVLDRVDRAVLSVKGITEPEEIELVERRKAETGRGLEELLATTWFKQELQEFREKATSFEVMPSGSKRSNQAARDSVQYWISKGELPPKNQVQLRRDVVNARMAKAKDGNIFADQSVV
jgi:hypothetical protein